MEMVRGRKPDATPLGEPTCPGWALGQRIRQSEYHSRPAIPQVSRGENLQNTSLHPASLAGSSNRLNS